MSSLQFIWVEEMPIAGRRFSIPKAQRTLKGLSHDMDLAFDDMYG
jgi:hypothetical protein